MRVSIVIILLIVAASITAQAIVYPFACLPDVAPVEFPARSIWLGYDSGGWDVPQDVRLVYRYNDKWVNTYRVYYSKTLDEYYVFVYDQPPIDEGKGYLSWHPCGQGAISPEQYQVLLDG
jgi:hypothetical protein